MEFCRSEAEQEMDPREREEMERERLRELNLAARESLEIEGEW